MDFLTKFIDWRRGPAGRLTRERNLPGRVVRDVSLRVVRDVSGRVVRDVSGRVVRDVSGRVVRDAAPADGWVVPVWSPRIDGMGADGAAHHHGSTGCDAHGGHASASFDAGCGGGHSGGH